MQKGEGEEEEGMRETRTEDVRDEQDCSGGAGRWGGDVAEEGPAILFDS